MTRLRLVGWNEALSRLPEFIRSIPDVLRDPAGNSTQAAILLGIVIVVVLIVLVSVVLLIMRPSRDEEEALLEPQTPEQIAEDRRARRLSSLTVTSVIILVMIGLWVVAGVTTSSADVCASCHSDTSHTDARSDPHTDVSCVWCHEGGGWFARVTVNVGTRVQHAILGRYAPMRAKGYGKPAASDGCEHCHDSQITGTSYDRSTGILVSHKEPMAAGAQCVDCHALISGVVTAATVGMGPCLRCHNDETTKADCSVCHVGDPARAIRSNEGTVSMASQLVPNPQCNGCHTDMSKCNACHGIAMPHSVEFRVYAHARDAAIDIWKNGQAGPLMCEKCHYQGHRSCFVPGGCHAAPFPSHPSPVWRTMHALNPWSGSGTGCSCHNWNPWDHNGMTYCEICHKVKPKNAKP